MNNKSHFYISYNLKEFTADISTSFSSRFKNDKIYHNDDECSILLDGILLNKQELFEEYGIKELPTLLKRLYTLDKLPKDLRGAFCGAYISKKEQSLLAFGNQTGDSSIFYFTDQNNIHISNDFNKLASIISKKKLNEKSAHFLLTYGFIVDDDTIIEGIKRLQAGKALIVRNGEIKISTYKKFNFKDKIEISLEEAIEQLDVKFRHAVKRCFDKDIEYGYTNHLIDISAGLDSRMTNVVAKELGYKNILNITYSQSNSDEDKYVKLLSNYLKNQIYYRKLDNASFLLEIEELIKMVNGLSFYCGITAGKQFLETLNFDLFGLEHTGQLGDVVISSFVVHDSTNINTNVKRNSNRIDMRYPVVTDAETQEEFMMRTRGFQGALSTHYLRSNYTYAVSPFLDVDLIDFCISLPEEIRSNHRLYWLWVEKKYPEVAKIKSNRLNTASSTAKIKSYLTRIINRLEREKYKIGYKLGIYKYQTCPNNMNPFTYWYETNEEILKFISDYYNNHINLVQNFEVLQKEIETLYNSPIALDKLIAISLLSTISVYINE